MSKLQSIDFFFRASKIATAEIKLQVVFKVFLLVFANAEHFIGSKSEKIILGFFKA